MNSFLSIVPSNKTWHVTLLWTVNQTWACDWTTCLLPWYDLDGCLDVNIIIFSHGVFKLVTISYHQLGKSKTKSGRYVNRSLSVVVTTCNKGCVTRCLWIPDRGWGYLMSSPSGISGLSFESSFLFPLWFFFLVLLLFLSSHFSAANPFSWHFSSKFSNIFRRLKSLAFLNGSCWAARGWQVVCAAGSVWHCYLPLCSYISFLCFVLKLLFLSIPLKNSRIDKLDGMVDDTSMS